MLLDSGCSQGFSFRTVNLKMSLIFKGSLTIKNTIELSGYLFRSCTGSGYITHVIFYRYLKTGAS